MRRFVTIVAVLLVAVLGCAEEKTKEKSVDTAATKSVETATSESTQAWKGNVVETMNSGGYTYVLMDTSDKQVWVAGPVAEISVGDKVIMQPGGEMRNFTSKTLNRTFDVIYFVRGIELDDGHTHGPGEAGH